MTVEVMNFEEQPHTNPLLQKSELGKVSHRGINLPPKSFIYGMPNVGELNGAATALSSWSRLEKKMENNSDKPGLKRSKTLGSRDFVALNKAATRRGMFTAHEFSQYRATHNIEKQPVLNKGQDKAPEEARIAPETVFGLPTRPCTPVFDLIEHKYQERWLEERRRQEQASRSKSMNSRRSVESRKKMSSPTLGKAGSHAIYETRTSLLRKHLPPIENHELWQIRRFKKVPSHVSSFRSEKERRSAVDHQSMDGAARFGYLGQGIYATPPY